MVDERLIVAKCGIKGLDVLAVEEGQCSNVVADEVRRDIPDPTGLRGKLYEAVDAERCGREEAIGNDNVF